MLASMCRRPLLSFLVVFILASPASAQVERIWLTHRSNGPEKIVVNWETTAPGPSRIEFGPTEACEQSAGVEDDVTLHHVEIPLAADVPVYHYRVVTGEQKSPVYSFRNYTGDELRIAVVADWHAHPKLDALLADQPHLLLTGGDNISNLHSLCGVGAKDCTKPYSRLVDAYPELFRTTPFLPVLGNHDREIRPRGDKPPPEPVYDVDATAFRRFFPLPDSGWKWHFDLPRFNVRLVGLDLNHISDQGTTWQTCHPLKVGSEQFDWYEKLMNENAQPIVVTMQNERNATMRGQEKGAWQRLFQKGTAVITGFGHFAERAEHDGVAYFNTSLSGRGTRYPDPQSKALYSENNYLLLTVRRGQPTLRVEIKNLAGETLDKSAWPQ
jgi:hypothetical protein